MQSGVRAPASQRGAHRRHCLDYDHGRDPCLTYSRQRMEKTPTVCAGMIATTLMCGGLVREVTGDAQETLPINEGFVSSFLKPGRYDCCRLWARAKSSVKPPSTSTAWPTCS